MSNYSHLIAYVLCPFNFENIKAEMLLLTVSHHAQFNNNMLKMYTAIIFLWAHDSIFLGSQVSAYHLPDKQKVPKSFVKVQ